MLKYSAVLYTGTITEIMVCRNSMPVEMKRLKKSLLRSKISHAALLAYLSVSAIPLRRRLIRHDKPSNWQRKTYLEKVRWRCKNPDPSLDYSVLVDKLRVREYVSPDLNVPKQFGNVRDPADINADSLPDSFVMKATHGWNMYVWVKDGLIQRHSRSCDDADLGRSATSEILQEIASGWLDSPEYLLLQARECQYRGIGPGIMFEEYLQFEYELEMFLFNGVCQITMVHLRKYDDGAPVSDGYRLYDREWLRLEPGLHAGSELYNHSSPDVPPPDGEFLRKLEKLCGHIDHVRADFLVRDGVSYLNELTFTHNAGKPSLLGPHEAELGRFWN